MIDYQLLVSQCVNQLHPYVIPRVGIPCHSDPKRRKHYKLAKKNTIDGPQPHQAHIHSLYRIKKKSHRKLHHNLIQACILQLSKLKTVTHKHSFIIDMPAIALPYTKPHIGLWAPLTLTTLKKCISCLSIMH